jgi:tetrahydromethanopterin S-methyltransferase subunit G
MDTYIYNGNMDETPETIPPQIELAHKDWTLREITDSERRFEKAFHKQTIYIGKRMDEMNLRIDGVKGELSQMIMSQTRWIVGMMMTMTIAIIIAVLFKN